MEVWKQSQEYDSAKSLGDTFLTSCDVDKDTVKDKLQDIKNRWENLTTICLLEVYFWKIVWLSDFNENLLNLNHAIGRCEDRFSVHDALGGAATHPKLLDFDNTINDDVFALLKPMRSPIALVQNI